MIRTFFTLCLVGLIGGTGWAAAGMRSDRAEAGARVGVVILAALQR